MELKISQVIIYSVIVFLLITSFINKTSGQICFLDLIDDGRNRRLRPELYATYPTSRIIRETVVDDNSHVTFSCEARWLRSPGYYRRRALCELASLNLESAEDLATQLALAMEWEIDQMGPFNSSNLTPTLTERGIVISKTCEFETQELFQLLEHGISYCRDRLYDIDTITLQCTSVLNITRVAANSNVHLQCSVRPQNCTDEWFIDRSSQFELMLQGLLGPPPELRVDKLNSTTVFLSWNRPSTLSGIPISHYSVEINNLVNVSAVNITEMDQPLLDQNKTSLDLSSVGPVGYLYVPGCESLQFSVSAWNSVGGGARNTVVYSQESLLSVKVYTALHSTDVICVLCGFASTSEAQGCQVTLQKETNIDQNDNNNNNMSTVSTLNFLASKTEAVNEAFDCFSELSAGNYTVKVREIECTGGVGLREFLHNHVMISTNVSGMHVERDEQELEATESMSSSTDRAQGAPSNSQTIGFSMAVTILVIIVLLLVVLVIVLIARKAKDSKEVPLKGNQTRSATLTQHTSPQSSTDQQPKKDLVYDQDLLYENDFSVGPINDDPSTEYSYTVVAHSRKVESNNGLEMNPCIAYGKTTRPS